VVELDALVYALWGGEGPRTVENTLQVHVSHLRRMLGDRKLVRRTSRGYALEVPRTAVDAEQFVDDVHAAADDCRQGAFQEARDRLEAALELWRGTPFLGLHDPDLKARRVRLEEMRSSAREDLLRCRLELARDPYQLNGIIAEARELVARHPSRERGHSILIEALTSANRTAEAAEASASAASMLPSG
jgi:DNA-binding SARP family transcriptional activator